MTGETGLPSSVGVSRLAGVDVLRGLCVLLVLLNHVKLRFLLNDLPVTDALPARLEQIFFWSGHYAVVTFFVISGFLITGLSLRRWGSLGSVDIGSFYRMRFARIAPCLLLLLLILTALHLAGAADFVIRPERASLGRALLGDTDPWWGYAYFSCADAIAFGCIAALVAHHRLLGPRGLRLALLAGCSLSLLTLVLFKENEHTGLARFGLHLSALELGVALMVIAFGSGVGNASMAKGTRWLRIVGRCSYEIYLFHMLIVLGLIAIVRQLHATRAYPLWYAAMLCGSALLGYLIARIYSEPLNRRIRASGLAFGAGRAQPSQLTTD